MKESLLIIVLLLSTFTTYGQEKTNNSYFTWENFVDGFGKEKVKIMVYAVPVNDSFYQITFMDSEKEDNSKLFEKIVESIEIEE